MLHLPIFMRLNFSFFPQLFWKKLFYKLDYLEKNTKYSKKESTFMTVVLEFIPKNHKFFLIWESLCRQNAKT